MDSGPIYFANMAAEPAAHLDAGYIRLIVQCRIGQHRHIT